MGHGQDVEGGGHPPVEEDVITDEGPVRPMDWTGTADPTAGPDQDSPVADGPAGGAADGSAMPSSSAGGERQGDGASGTSATSSTASSSATQGMQGQQGQEDLRDQGVAPLAASAAADVQGIAQAELQLAKTEVAEQARGAALGAGAVAAGAATGLVGAIFALLGLTELLARWMPRWAAATLVGGVLAASGAGLAKGGGRRLAEVRPPELTVRTLKENAAWIRARTSRATS